MLNYIRWVHLRFCPSVRFLMPWKSQKCIWCSLFAQMKINYMRYDFWPMTLSEVWNCRTFSANIIRVVVSGFDYSKDPKRKVIQIIYLGVFFSIWNSVFCDTTFFVSSIMDTVNSFTIVGSWSNVGLCDLIVIPDCQKKTQMPISSFCFTFKFGFFLHNRWQDFFCQGSYGQPSVFKK